MEKKKIEIIVTSVSVIVFLILLISTLSKRPQKAVQPAPPPAQGKEAVMPSIPEGGTPRQMQWGRDPFVLGQARKAPVDGPFELTAVIWDENKPLAVINGEVVSMGREISGYTVSKINKENVILTKDGKEQIVHLYK